MKGIFEKDPHATTMMIKLAMMILFLREIAALGSSTTGDSGIRGVLEAALAEPRIS